VLGFSHVSFFSLHLKLNALYKNRPLLVRASLTSYYHYYYYYYYHYHYYYYYHYNYYYYRYYLLLLLIIILVILLSYILIERTNPLKKFGHSLSMGIAYQSIIHTQARFTLTGEVLPFNSQGSDFI